jgi:hypothetical protein
MPLTTPTIDSKRGFGHFTNFFLKTAAPPLKNPLNRNLGLFKNFAEIKIFPSCTTAVFSVADGF